MMGVEPTASYLANKCSTVELHPQMPAYAGEKLIGLTNAPNATTGRTVFVT